MKWKSKPTGVCPKCGNNTCNACYGEINAKDWCDVCPLAYQYNDRILEIERGKVSSRG